MKPTAVNILLPGLLLLGVALAAAQDPLPRLSTKSPDDITVSTRDQNVSVTCYQGNPNAGGSTLGSIQAMATMAGSTCNSLYYDCQGRCYGCYSDFDLSEDVCVDSAGRRFLR
jgi:hypothetical protein